MAFDLQKNEESTDSPKRPGFDLSKNDDQPMTELSKKQPYWIYAALTLLIAGGVAWYFLQRPGTSSALSKNTTLMADKTLRNSATDGSPATAAVDASSSKTDPVAEAPSAPSEPAIAKSDQKAVQSADQVKGPNTIAPRIAAVFSAGSSVPRSPAKTVISQFKRQLQADPALRVYVWGYASSEGDAAYNQVISQARADAYKAYLISKGVSASQIVAEGKGINDPIATNRTEAGRRKNRRVEVQYTN
ncbi:OmpA family protein [Mucilaginibacter daejeonensis]|uniref:OmpA family protein n=1 Tax=Mucilaginibacter daejeonensis TaxID=398049 RepID=UPI001D17C995|nr:OmpA family protein [Mucilaginibacter daejeonensis]UEG51451.1 OmpA family protein [Mucilaginibacter daejeonensis]